MASIVVAGDTSGTITLSAPAVSGTNTLTLPANTGTVLTTASTFAGTGPAFSAFPTTATTSLPHVTFTSPIAFDTEQFDTASCFNNTNATVGGIPAYAFKPTFAGYYQINGCVSFSGANIGGSNFLAIVKNGTEFVDGAYFYTGGSTAVTISFLMYLNGSSDYIQLGAYQNSGVTKTTSTGLGQMYFQGFFARSA